MCVTYRFDPVRVVKHISGESVATFRECARRRRVVPRLSENVRKWNGARRWCEIIQPSVLSALRRARPCRRCSVFVDLTPVNSERAPQVTQHKPQTRVPAPCCCSWLQTPPHLSCSWVVQPVRLSVCKTIAKCTFCASSRWKITKGQIHETIVWLSCHKISVCSFRNSTFADWGSHQR